MTFTPIGASAVATAVPSARPLPPPSLPLGAAAESVLQHLVHGALWMLLHSEKR